MKKLGSILCSVLTLATLFSFLSVGASAAVDAWDGSTTVNWYDKDAAVLIIDSAEDLSAFMVSVNYLGDNYEGKTVELACDIVWAGGALDSWQKTPPSKTWTPIGTLSSPFNGTFDGRGHTVSGLYYENGRENAGFFGCVSGAVIKNLDISNSYFEAYKIIGSVVGRSQGDLTLVNCSSDALIVSTDTVAENHDVGGIVGGAYGIETDLSFAVSISDCSFVGKIKSDKGCNVGGIAGSASGAPLKINGCLTDATIVGYNRVSGILGRAYSDVEIYDCYSDCDISVWGTLNVGGIIGGFRVPDNTIYIHDSFYSGEFFDASSSTYSSAKKVAIPTRIGSNEVDLDGETVFGTFSTASNFYTDSANDNSYVTSGNQTALSEDVKCLGGLDEFLSSNDTFALDMYGNVYNTSILCEHDHAGYFGEWIDDPTGDGQIRECLYGGCGETEIRGLSMNITGVSVRYDAPAGIRFLTEVDKNTFFRSYYSGERYKYAGADITFGTLVIPTDMLDGELTVDTEGVLDIEAKAILSQDSNKLRYTAVIYGLPETIEGYRSDITVRSYAKYTDGQNTVYEYSEPAKSSYHKVAEMVCVDERASANVKERLNLITALGLVDEDFYAEDPQRVYLIEDANVKLFDDYAAALEAEGFVKHTNYEASGNHFGIYYNDDYTVTFYYTPKTIGTYTDTDQSKWYAAGNYHDDWATINKYVSVDDAENIMRVIVEKTADTVLPALPSENTYTKLPGQKNTLAHVFPTNSDAKNCMGYILQLADGSFIIIDSGYDTTDPKTPNDLSTEADYYYNYLVSNKPESHEKPIIAAWILTHQHGDHINALKGFLANETYANGVVIEQFIYNFMESEDFDPDLISGVRSFADKYITPNYSDAKIITAHTGYKFYIRNAEISILYSIDDFAPNKVSTFSNNESLVFDVIIDGTQRLMITGDMFIPASRALINMYGEDLKSDVIQIAHHGNFGAIPEFNALVWPDSEDYTSDLKFALLPNPRVSQSKTRLKNPENTCLQKVVENDGLSWADKLYATYEILFDAEVMGKDVLKESTFKVSNAYKGNGKWQTIELYTAQ